MYFLSFGNLKCGVPKMDMEHLVTEEKIMNFTIFKKRVDISITVLVHLVEIPHCGRILFFVPKSIF